MPRTLKPSDHIAHYRVVGPLGAGGMGEVYRATDQSLERDVALKVLPPELVLSEERVRRFTLEAKSASSLNHPHIVHIYEIGEDRVRGDAASEPSSGSLHYIAMELVQGKTLSAKIHEEKAELKSLLGWLAQAAEGVAKAHAAGIVHRDLKPGNIMVSSDGYAKVLDFGLAKLTERAAGDADLSAAPTVTAGEQTSEGVVVGTVGYMAPEQVRGQAVDARADVFAFGCMLYEAAARRRPFAAESQVETLHRILHDVPAPVEELNPEAPAELRRLVRRCLAKDPNHRPQSMRDLALELREIVEEYENLSLSLTVPNDPAQRRRLFGYRLAWIVAGIATAVALGALLLPRMTGRAVKAGSQRFGVSVPGLRMGGSSEWFAISPDGRTLVFLADDTAGRSQLWIRPLASLEARPLEGTDSAAMPFWSPDSRWIGFFADQKLKRVAIGGGDPEILCAAANGRGGSWGRDGTILFAPATAGPICRVAEGGGDPEEIMRPDTARGETGLRWPQVLPDGRRYLFASLPGRGGEYDIYLATAGSTRRTRVLRSATMPVYAPPGFLLFQRMGSLVAQRFDARSGSLTGQPTTLGEAPRRSFSMGVYATTVSENGVLAHGLTGMQNVRFVWVDRSGHEVGRLATPPGPYEATISFSPDGRRFATLGRNSANSVDLWVIDVATGVPSRLTNSPGRSMQLPTWSPDGKWIVYNANSSGLEDIFRIPADGGEEQTVFRGTTPFSNVCQWTPDGRSILFRQTSAGTGMDLWMIPLEGDRTPVPLVRSRFFEGPAFFSPDMRWLSWTSDESGRSEVYVQPWPPAGRRIQVSGSGAFAATWSKDGRRLLLYGYDHTLSLVEVTTSPSLSASEPRRIFDPSSEWLGFGVTPDFERFLVMLPVGEVVASSSVVIELNWMAALEK